MWANVSYFPDSCGWANNHESIGIFSQGKTQSRGSHLVFGSSFWSNWEEFIEDDSEVVPKNRPSGEI
ncbi:MAG: hypothetical protein RLZZ506_626, partial [Bacteroidota bacterium]